MVSAYAVQSSVWKTYEGRKREKNKSGGKEAREKK
jgi:hypothetical protein